MADFSTKQTLERDARAGALIAQLASESVCVRPERRDQLWLRIDRLRAYRKAYWTPERFRAACEGVAP